MNYSHVPRPVKGSRPALVARRGSA